MTRPSPPTLAAFGLTLLTEARPPGAWERRCCDGPSLDIRLASAEEIEESWSGLAGIGWRGVIDGADFVVERGMAGDHRVVHGAPPDERGRPAGGTRALHHLNAEASILRCAPENRADPVWWRAVLDSVLFTVALLRGYEALHAGGVVTPEGVIAITAGTGGGKSTLLTELLGRGARLMADDVLILESRGTRAPLAHPGPPLMNVPSVRIPVLEEGGAVQKISSLGDECWIGVPVHGEALPLKALVLLDRRRGAETELQPIEGGDALALLLGSLMRFPDSEKRRRARFELASALACTTKLWRLSADLDTAASTLADTMDQLETVQKP